jgi:transcriptional regulator with XRE-family HTH domain
MVKKKQLKGGKSSGRMASKGFPNPIDVHVGQRIRLRRTLLGMSQGKLADAIGLTFQQIQKYEKGVNRVSPSRLMDFVAVLDVDVPYFFAEMTAAVAAQTPSQLQRAKLLPKNDLQKDPTVKRETLELVRAYYNISDPAVRKRLRELMLSVARSDVA